MSSQRLQKVLAQAGVASRRAAETLITEGRVRVNGRIVRELGARANPHKDRVEVDGRRLVAQRHVYFLMHKPRGVVTTLDDPEGRKTVKDLLRNINERVFPVGRLDFQTSGALLLTNDGDLAQALLHPTRAVPKTYNAKLEGELDADRLEQLRSGVVLDDGKKTAPAEVSILRRDAKATSVEITIAEGKNRQIHRMGEAIHRTVLRLTRISFAGLTLEKLRPGEMRPLTALEVSELKQAYLHKPKKRRPFKAYGEMELEEAGPLFAIDQADDDDSGDEQEPVRAPAQRGPSNTRAQAPSEERTGYQRGADNDRAKRGVRDDRTRRGPRDERASRQRDVAADDRATRDPRDRGGAKHADPRAKRDVRGKRNWHATRDDRAKRDEGTTFDPRAKRDARDDRAKRDEGAKYDPRAKRDARAKVYPRDDLAKRDPRAKTYLRDGRAKRDPRAKVDPRNARGKVDPRASRFQRAARGQRTEVDPRADFEQSAALEAQPRKYRGARTQPTKRTRSQASKTKRGGAPRKTKFKR